MISETVLRNFRRYMGTRPDLMPFGSPPAAPALGAYDSAGGLRGAHDALSLADFAPGGKHGGEANSGTPLDALRRIASKLSEADWSEFQQLLCEEDEPEGEEDAAEDETLEAMMPRTIYGPDGQELNPGLRDDNVGTRARDDEPGTNMGPRGRKVFTREDLGKDRQRRRPAADARPKGRYADLFDETFPGIRARIGFA